MKFLLYYSLELLLILGCISTNAVDSSSIDIKGYREIAVFFDSFDIKHIDSSLRSELLLLPNTGVFNGNLWDSKVTSIQKHALEVFHTRSKQILLKEFPVFSDKTVIEMTPEKYLNALSNKMSIIRYLTDYIEYDIAFDNKNAALKDFKRLVQFACLSINTTGDQKLMPTVPFMLAGQVSRIISCFSPTVDELSELKKLIDQYDNFLQSISPAKGSDSNYGNAITILRCTKVALACLLYEKEKDAFPEELSQLLPLYLSANDLMDYWGNRLHFKYKEVSVIKDFDTRNLLVGNDFLKVYSLGENQKDESGGKITGYTKENDDVTFIAKWK